MEIFCNMQDLQIQWEFIVSLLYETIVWDVLLSCPSIHLMVVEGQENEEHLCASNSSLEKVTIHNIMQVCWNKVNVNSVMGHLF